MMKRALFLFAVLAFAGGAQGQETYSIAANATQVGRLTIAVTKSNRVVCQGFALPATCTQAQACTAGNAAGGASCTAAQARSAPSGNVRIYPNTQPGREEFVTFALVLAAFNQLTSQSSATDLADLVAACKASTSTRDTLCTTAGLSAGCDICP